MKGIYSLRNLPNWQENKLNILLPQILAVFPVQGIQFSMFRLERSGLCSLREGWHSHVMRSWNPSCSSASPQWGAKWWMGRHPLLQTNSCNSCCGLVWHQHLGLPKIYNSCCLLAQRVTEENNLSERNSKDWKIAFCFVSPYWAETNPLLAIIPEILCKILATRPHPVLLCELQLTTDPRYEYYIVTRSTAKIWQTSCGRWRLSSLQNGMVALDVCDN